MADALISGEGDMAAKAKAMEVIARKAGIKGMVGGQAVDVELTGKHYQMNSLILYSD